MPTAQLQPASACAGTLFGKRILVVEDIPDVQRLMAHFLERAGASVTLAQIGQIGFDKALAARDANRPFDGILIDIVMPIMDGYTAVLALRASGIRTPILAVTALAMPRDRQRCLDAGCDDYITKPLDRRRFVSLVAQHVVRRSGEECVL